MGTNLRSNTSRTVQLDEFSTRGRARKIFVMSFGVFVFIHAVALAYLPIFGLKGTDWFTEYNLALYWTVTTLTTVGYGDITPSDNLSRTFTMLVMMAGVALYGIVIGQIAQYLVRVDRRAEAKREALEQLTGFFRHYDVPRELQEQSFSLVQHLLTHRMAEEEEKILEALPNALQAELKTHILVKRLSNVSLFHGCSRACLVDVTQKLVQVFATPNEQIVVRGTQGSDMYLISWGEALVHVDDEKLAVLKAGDCFGEMALVMEEARAADVTALGYCDLHRLGREELVELMGRHPDLAQNVSAIVAKRRTDTPVSA